MVKIHLSVNCRQQQENSDSSQCRMCWETTFPPECLHVSCLPTINTDFHGNIIWKCRQDDAVFHVSIGCYIRKGCLGAPPSTLLVRLVDDISAGKDTLDTVPVHIHIPRMFLSTDYLFEIKNGLGKLLRTLDTILRKINRSVPGLATDSPCGVWGRGLTICLLNDGPLLGLCLNSVGVKVWYGGIFFYWFLAFIHVSYITQDLLISFSPQIN